MSLAEYDRKRWDEIFYDYEDEEIRWKDACEEIAGEISDFFPVVRIEPYSK